MDRRERNTEDALRLGQMEFFNREKCTGGVQKRMPTIDKLNKTKDKEQNDDARKQPEGLGFLFGQDRKFRLATDWRGRLKIQCTEKSFDRDLDDVTLWRDLKVTDLVFEKNLSTHYRDLNLSRMFVGEQYRFFIKRNGSIYIQVYHAFGWEFAKGINLL